MRRYNNDPREITARYTSICAETGKTIHRGDTCIYYPSERKVFHVNSKQAQEFRSWMFDCAVLKYEY